jgi:hypothetical protein
VSPVLTLDRVTFGALVELRDALGDPDVQLRPHYEGRGMYGRSCLAVVTPNLTDLIRFLLGLNELVNDGNDEVAEQVASLVDELQATRTHVDQLGTGHVYYWPSVEVAS